MKIKFLFVLIIVSISLSLKAQLIEDRNIYGNIVSLNKYISGATQRLYFKLRLLTDDLEYADSVSLTFPVGMQPIGGSNPFSFVTQNQSAETLNPIIGNTISWGDNDNTFGGIEPGEHIFFVDIQCNPNIYGIQHIQYFISGDEHHGNINSISGFIKIEPRLPNDITAISINMPISSCNLSDSESVSFTVKNNGYDTITTFIAKLFIDEIHAKTDTFNTILLPDSNDSFVFTSTFSFSEIKKYKLKIELLLENDTNIVDNILEKIISSGNNLEEVYTMSFETNETDFENWTKTSNRWNIWQGGAHLGSSFVGYSLKQNYSSEWLFTSCFNLKANEYYELNFWIKTVNILPSDSIKFIVALGLFPNPFFMIDTLLIISNVSNNQYILVSKRFTVTTDTVFYIGFNITGKTIFPQIKLFCIDDFKLKKLYNNDLEITNLHTYSSLPFYSNFQLPSIITIVRNSGINPLNSSITFSTSGLINYQTTSTIFVNQNDTLTTLFNLPAFPQDTGSISLQITLANDSNNNNNFISKDLKISVDKWSCLHTRNFYNKTGTGNSNGITYVKYPSQSITRIKSVCFYLTDPNSIGQKVFAVISDSMGNIIDISDTITLLSSHLEEKVEISFRKPVIINLNNFFAGIGQLQSQIKHYPIACEYEYPACEGIFWKYDFSSNTLKNITDEGIFSIEVTRENKTPDLSLISIINPQPACKYQTNETVTCIIKNLGNLPVFKGEKINFSLEYKDTIVYDSLILIHDLLPQDSIIFTFSSSIDLSDAQNDTLIVELDYDFETSLSNNIMKYILQRLPLPENPQIPSTLKLCPDQLVTIIPYTIPNEEVKWYYETIPLSDTLTTMVFNTNDFLEGNYILVKTNNFNCARYDTIFLQHVQKPNIQINNIYHCKNAGPLQLDSYVEYADTIRWISTGDGYFDNEYSYSPSYYLGSTDSLSDILIIISYLENSCGHKKDTFFIELKNIPPIETYPENNICQGDSIFLCVSGGNNYLWFPANSVSDPFSACVWASPYQTTEYNVMIENECGFVNNTIKVNVIEPPSGIINGETSICFGDSVILSASEGENNNYSWGPSELINDPYAQQIIAYITENTYFSVTITNNCFTITDSVLITVNYPSISVFLGNDTIICADNQITLDANYQGFNYLWSNGATTQTITIDTSGIGLGTFTYWVIVYNDTICPSYDTINITFHTCQKILDYTYDQTIIHYNSDSKTISITSNFKISEIKLYNTIGEEIISINNINETFVNINTNKLAPGLYVISIIQDNPLRISNKKITIFH